MGVYPSHHRFQYKVMVIHDLDLANDLLPQNTSHSGNTLLFFGSTAVGLHCRRRKVGRSEGGRISTTKTDDITLTYFGEVNYISPSFWGSSDLRSRNMKYILYNYIYILYYYPMIFSGLQEFFKYIPTLRWSCYGLAQSGENQDRSLVGW